MRYIENIKKKDTQAPSVRLCLPPSSQRKALVAVGQLPQVTDFRRAYRVSPVICYKGAVYANGLAGDYDWYALFELVDKTKIMLYKSMKN